MADPIDVAFDTFTAIRSDFLAIPAERQTEADTRALIIDRMLREVLHWRAGQITREESEGDDRLDYRLSAASEFAVVEAKRSRLDFGIPATDTRWYRRTGPVAQAEPLSAAIEQVDGYAARWGCGLACATTGLQWVLFLGNRTDGVSRQSGHILVFRSLDDLAVAANFKLFYAALSEPSVRAAQFRLPFLTEEGIVVEPAAGTSMRLVDVRGRERQRKRSELAKTLEPLLKEVFEGLSSAQNLKALRTCFVETKESAEADARLQRITRELTDDIEPIDTRADGGSDRLSQLVEAEVQDQSVDKPSATILILGQHGAGKSTFIDIFFADKLPPDIRKKCLVVKIDLSKADPDPRGLPGYLKERTVTALEEILFDEEGPSYNQLKGIFHSEYVALAKGALAPLKQAKPEEFEIEFGKRLEQLQRDRERYLTRLLENTRLSRRRLVCVVFDNADHFDDEFQKTAFLHAQWTAGLSRMLLLLPMRDTTYWRAREQSAFHAVRNTALYLPRPPLAAVLERRFEFAASELHEGDAASIVSLKGFKVRVPNSAELLRGLQKAFTKDPPVSRTLSMLASGDVREALRLFEACVTSPHISLDRLLAAYLAEGNYRIGHAGFMGAVILGEWEQFAQERSRRICNLLCNPRDASISPLLALRVLLRCYELRSQDNTGTDRGFVSVDSILAFFQTMGVGRAHSDRAIGILLHANLIEPYELGSIGPDFDGSGSSGVKHVKMTSSGLLHKNWIQRNNYYARAMLDDVQIFDNELLSEAREVVARRGSALASHNYGEADRQTGLLVQLVRDHILQRDAELVTLPATPTASPSVRTQQALGSVLMTWLPAVSSEQV